MRTSNLLTEKPRKLFFKYLLPSISATLVTSIYILADTIMIGQGIGASGLAALNLVLPLFTALFGVGLLFGVGGGVLMSVATGKGDGEKGNRYFTTAMVGASLVSILIATLGMIFFDEIAYFLGANEGNIHLVRGYGKYLVAFAPMFVGSTLLQSLVRNDRAPGRAMIGVISGGVINIVLDYIFIFELNMGMTGGAVATVIGSTITVVILLTHFRTEENTMKFVKSGFSFNIAKEIFKCGASSFLIEVASGIVVFFFNIQLISYIGEVGVVVYGIIANFLFIAMSLFNGVAQASQPIMANNYGAGKVDRVIEVRNIGSITSIVIGTALFFIGYMFPEFVIKVFVSPTPEIMTIGVSAIKTYIVAVLMMNLNIFYCNYFQSIIRPNLSLIICLLRGVILSTALVFILPKIFGATAIWLVMPLTEGVTLIVSLILIKLSDRKYGTENIESLAID